jgi:LytS/YehU family sensor histidine kinase
VDIIVSDICRLVTAVFTLTLVPDLRQRERSWISSNDQRAALLIFLVLSLVEEFTGSHAGWLNEPIVVVCAAGLVGGPWVGLAVSVFVTWVMDCATVSLIKSRGRRNLRHFP